MVGIFKTIQTFLGISSILAADTDIDKNLPYSPHYYPSPQTGRTADNDWADAVTRAQEFVSQLTLAEKVNLTTGTLGPCVGNTGSLPEHDFWGLCLQDGPLGIRITDLVTGFPPGISAGATFNKALINARGHAIGYEFAQKGADIALGPVVGPVGLKALGGRLFESFGADQYLQGIAGAETVKGMQDEGVMANAKHYIGNEQEYNRTTISSNMDDRTLHEVYVWPFADLVKAGVGSVMCSYNLLNNSWGCENSYTLNHVLKDELGFQGFVVSDWGATHSGVNAITSGEDMDMPGSEMWGANITISVLNETLPMDRLDDMAIRIMSAYYKIGLDKERKKRGPPSFNTKTLKSYDYEFPEIGWGPFIESNKHVDVRRKQHYDVAYQTALESVVLLKNENATLPLSNDTKRLAVIGAAAGDNTNGATCSEAGCQGSEGYVDGSTQLGWGSGATNYPYYITPYDGIKQRANQDWITVDSYFGNDTKSIAYNHTVGASELNIIVALSTSGEGWDREDDKLWLGGEKVITDTIAQSSNNVIVISSLAPVDMEKFINHENVTAVVFALPGGQDTGKAIASVLFGDHNPSGKLPFTIAKDSKDYVEIVKNKTASNGHEQDYTLGETRLLLDYKYFDYHKIGPRFEFGYGLSYTEFTFGDQMEITEITKPSEHLPPPAALKAAQYFNGSLPNADDLLFPDNITPVPSFNYPYLNSTSWADKHGEKYKFPDGYSTTQRQKSSLAGGASGGNPALWQTAYNVKVNITNTGDKYGQQVVQLYIGYPESGENEFPGTPVKQLRGFEKVGLDVDQSSTVEFDILTRHLTVWDVKTASWVVQRGEYKVYVGSSSADELLKLTDTISI